MTRPDWDSWSGPTLLSQTSCPGCCGEMTAQLRLCRVRDSGLFAECCHPAPPATRADVLLRSLAQSPQRHTRPHTRRPAPVTPVCPWLPRAGWEGLTPAPRKPGCGRNTAEPCLRSPRAVGAGSSLGCHSARILGQPPTPSTARHLTEPFRACPYLLCEPDSLGPASPFPLLTPRPGKRPSEIRAAAIRPLGCGIPIL